MVPILLSDGVLVARVALRLGSKEFGFEWTRKGLIFYNSGSEISDLLIHEEQVISLIFHNPKMQCVV